MTFDDCEWKQNYTSIGLPAQKSFCLSNCPDDKVRVAMEHDNTCARMTGSRAKCCSPNYTTTKKVVDPLVQLWEADLRGWLDNPKCPNAYEYTYDGFLDKRAYTESGLMADAPSLGFSSELSFLDKRQDELSFTSNQILVVLTDIIYAFRATTRTSKAVKEIKVWNDIIGAKFAYLVTTQLIPFLTDVADEFYSAVAEELAGRIVCNLDYWNQMIRDCTAAVPTGTNVTCLNIDIDQWDSEFSLDPDTYGTNENSASTKRFLSVLDKRDGSPRSFTIDCGIDLATGLRRIMIIESVAYPNGGNGDNLEQANGLTVRFALANWASGLMSLLILMHPTTFGYGLVSCLPIFYYRLVHVVA
jgi:chitinase